MFENRPRQNARAPARPRGVYSSRVVAAFLFFSLASSPADATVLRAASVEELTRGAELVLRGRVSKLDSRLVDGGRRIASLVTVDVAEAYKGRPEKRVELLLPGGTHGDLVQTQAGVPDFDVGEEVVLFLDPHPSLARDGGTTRFTLMSMGLGAFFVEEGEAIRRTVGLRVITGPLDRPRELSLDERVMPLTRLEERIRFALRESPR